MKKLLTSVFLVIFAGVSGLAQEKTNPAKVEYSVSNDSNPPHTSVLRAGANGKTIDRALECCRHF